jgi:hypothetical protein
MKLKFCSAFFVLLASNFANAQLLPELGSQRAGTAAAQFLKIGVGGRAVGMGETFIAVANDASALYWNPAGMAQFEDNQLILSHVDWPVDIKHEFVGYVHHLSSINAIGVSFTSLHMEDMEETTEFAPTGTGNFFTFRDIAIGLSYARRMTDKFSFGTTVKYIEETLAEVEMRSVMVDLGMYIGPAFARRVLPSRSRISASSSRRAVHSHAVTERRSTNFNPSCRRRCSSSASRLS